MTSSVPDVIETPRRIRPMIGTILVRAAVPVWILTGALFKLSEAMPRYLPAQVRGDAMRAGIDLMLLLAVLISLEFLAIAVMVFLGRYARAMAIFMLSCFMLILLRDMYVVIADSVAKAAADGSSAREGIKAGLDSMKCGCFGSKSPPLYVMLAIDSGLLLLVSIFRPLPAPRPSRGTLVAAALFFAAATAVTFVRIRPPPFPPPAPPAPAAAHASSSAAPGAPGAAAARALPDLPRRADFETAVARARRWLDKVDVDPVELEERGYGGAKLLAEILNAYAVLDRFAAGADDHARIRARVADLARHVERPEYHAIADADDEAFARSSMSYLRVAILLERFGVDVTGYRRWVNELRPRLDAHMPARGGYQRGVFALYYDHFGLPRPAALAAGTSDRGVVTKRLPALSYDERTMYELTHWVFLAFEYGARPDQDLLDAGDLDYLRATLPELVYDAMRIPDPDIVAELRSCMTYLGMHDDPMARKALDFLLDRQNEEGTWGSYEMMRIAHGRFVDQAYSLHTTQVALIALVEAYMGWPG
jgi:hypothetical protein